MKNITKLIIAIFLCNYIEYVSASSLDLLEESSETHSSDITTSGSFELSAKPKKLIPPVTYDTTFKLLFGREKYLKAFLNDIYGYDEACYIDKIEYLPIEHTGIRSRGRTSCDIRCKCTLNTADENGVIEFILEMQRKRQAAFMDRTSLESSIVISDDYTRSMSDSAKIPQKRKQRASKILCKKEKSRVNKKKITQTGLSKRLLIPSNYLSNFLKYTNISYPIFLQILLGFGILFQHSEPYKYSSDHYKPPLNPYKTRVLQSFLFDELCIFDDLHWDNKRLLPH